MSAPTDLAIPSVRQFAERFRQQMTPLSDRFAYHATGLNLTEDDIKDYLREPIAALPPSVMEVLPRVLVFLVPHIARVDGKDGHGKDGNGNKPAERRGGTPAANGSAEKVTETSVSHVMQWVAKDEAALLFAVNDQEVADYHYRLYHLLSMIVAERMPQELLARFQGLLREELTAEVHGEVDDESWHLKQALLRRQTTVRRDTKAFLAYAQQSLVDTLTLYLHGICCDIDVEPGPRQIASRHLRKRLNLLHQMFPPPKGYAVFPEELQTGQ